MQTLAAFFCVQLYFILSYTLIFILSSCVESTFQHSSGNRQLKKQQGLTARVRYKIFPDHNIILQEFQGLFTYPRIKTALQDIWQDPDYNPSCNGMSDMRQSSLSMSAEDMRQFMDFFIERKKGQSKIALLLGGPMENAMGVYFRSRLKEMHNTQIFSDPTEACEFLDLDTKTYHRLYEQEFKDYSHL